MKFVQIAILGLVGESAALPMLSSADNCLAATANAAKCNQGGAYVAAGLEVDCALPMRG